MKYSSLHNVNLFSILCFLGIHGLPTRTGKIKNLEYFDANFFGVHAKQAEVMDPQLRLLLESTYECIVDAGEPIISFILCTCILKSYIYKLMNM